MEPKRDEIWVKKCQKQIDFRLNLFSFPLFYSFNVFECWWWVWSGFNPKILYAYIDLKSFWIKSWKIAFKGLFVEAIFDFSDFLTLKNFSSCSADPTIFYTRTSFTISSQKKLLNLSLSSLSCEFGLQFFQKSRFSHSKVRWWVPYT